MPLLMPASVRAARVVVFVMAGLGVLTGFVVGAAAGADNAGRSFAPYLMTCVLFVLAFRYPKAGSGVRVTSIVLASVQILLALGATANRTPFGIIPLAGAVAVVVLLSRSAAGEWFRRHRANGVPPQFT
ncbi:hypothetical protein [Streptomyces sp. NPDC007904]|uniref:hypothetical protein n=1 Tax=Streptomyces sp. NPDC007904 TaxID=3364787 RepID=UPI0036F1449C